jgi:hypothetical protein
VAERQVVQSTFPRTPLVLTSSKQPLSASCAERNSSVGKITILKFLAGHTGGRASLREVTHAVSLLISSGSDWTKRTKRLAMLAPKLDIFSCSFVVRDDRGWQITENGLRFLASLEAALVARRSETPQTSEIAVIAPPSALLPLRLIGLKKRTPRRNRVDRNRRSAA